MEGSFFILRLIPILEGGFAGMLFEIAAKKRLVGERQVVGDFLHAQGGGF